MTKKHFIALAEHIKAAQHDNSYCEPFTLAQVKYLATFCGSTNSAFNRERWLGYIAGSCGPNGGKVSQTDNGFS